jgi:hypothetical protein
MTLRVPRRQEELTYDVVIELLSAHVNEISFDWKEMLPSSKDERGKNRLTRERSSDGQLGRRILGVRRQG